ncbi:MAG: FAD binding domain-containing protein [Spirochaetota bacterium]
MKAPQPSTVFLLNGDIVHATAWPGMPLIDFLREEWGLTGTKEGCREGDCGACAVLVGEQVDIEGTPGLTPRYRAHPSCLMRIGELENQHLITIEGLCQAAESSGLEAGLTPVMRALLDENASQCGFCSPGFVISLSAWLLGGLPLTPETAVQAVEGNLCRCTGYSAIRRAAAILAREFSGLPADPVERVRTLAAAGVIPASALRFATAAAPRARFTGTDTDNSALQPISTGTVTEKPTFQPLSTGTVTEKPLQPLVLGGGTDLSVRHPHPEPGPAIFFTRLDRGLSTISEKDGSVSIGAAVTIRDFFESPLVRRAVPGIEAFEDGFASILIRNRATIAGNIVNASPVADMTSILLALGSSIQVADASGEGPGRSMPLASFFRGYKSIALEAGQIVTTLSFYALGPHERFHFAKLSKRERLDIAAVNSGIRIALAAGGRSVLSASISAGGVAAVPRLLPKASATLAGVPLSVETALAAAYAASSEIEPIGDVRGSAGYRRLALERLLLSHFASLFPELGEGIGAALVAQGGSR